MNVCLKNLTGPIALLTAFCVCSAQADPLADFNEAVHLDLVGESQRAFALYLRAARSGLSQAQFDVAIMLDSGRGVQRDVGESALWYARAAAHGSQRAAYNLGQLYEAGEGVPQNPDLAHAWFSASGLRASSTHNQPRHSSSAHDTIEIVAPDLRSPSDHARLRGEDNGLVLVWTSKPQPVAVTFYVELRSVDKITSREIFSGSSKLTSIFVPITSGGSYAWRVIATSEIGQQYQSSKWIYFDLIAEPN